MAKSGFCSAAPQAYHRPPFLRGVRPHSRGPLGFNSVITRRFSLRLLADVSPQSTDHAGSLGDVNCGSAHPHEQLSELGPQDPHPTVLQLQRVFQLFEARLQDRALPALSHRASGLL
jgi:hypothetical protein